MVGHDEMATPPKVDPELIALFNWIALNKEVDFIMITISVRWEDAAHWPFASFVEIHRQFRSNFVKIARTIM